MSAYETIQTILGFGMFTIALIALIVKLLKMTRKITVYFDQARLFLNNKIGHRLKRLYIREICWKHISLFYHYSTTTLKRPSIKMPEPPISRLGHFL